MPDTLTITREWLEMLFELPGNDALHVLKSVSVYALDGIEDKKELDGLSENAIGLFRSMKRTIQDRARKVRYITKVRKNRLQYTSTVDASLIEGKPSTVDVYSRRSEMIEQNLFNIKEDQENNLKDITMDLLKEDREKINQKENEENKPTARRVFKVPTLEEVRDYIFGKGYSVDPEEFFSFYESQGWHVGKNKMRDWHRAVSYWQCRINNRNKTRSQLRDYSGI